MRKDLNYKFKVSISREGYEDKQTVKMCLSQVTAKKIGRAKLAFKEQEVTPDEFLSYAVKGYAFCNLFRFDENKKYWIKSGERYSRVSPVYKRGANKGYFKLNFKADEFFYGSQTIFVDIDYTKFDSVMDYIKCLTYKPTCVYTSYSDLENKQGIVSRRFRLLYVFDSVLNAEQFKEATFFLYDSIIADTKEPMSDLCGCSYSQYMNGTNHTECYISNVIYSFSDIERTEVIKESEIPKQPKQEVKKSNKIEFTDELVKDMEHLTYELVVRKWFAKGLRYVTKSQMEFNNYYTTNTENYISLFYIPSKIEDGKQRRKKLYIRAALRRLMKDFTPDELLYNLYIDREKFFDNSDNVLTIEVLQNKVKAALKTDIKTIQGIVKDYKKPTFVINPEVSDKRQAVAKARTEIKDNNIGLYYDTTLTINENLNIMKENGLKISKSRLYKWCGEYGVKPVKSTTRKKKETLYGYNPILSIRENMKAMNCTMYQVQKAKEEYYTNKN